MKLFNRVKKASRIDYKSIIECMLCKIFTNVDDEDLNEISITHTKDNKNTKAHIPSLVLRFFKKEYILINIIISHAIKERIISKIPQNTNPDLAIKKLITKHANKRISIVQKQNPQNITKQSTKNNTILANPENNLKSECSGSLIIILVSLTLSFFFSNFFSSLTSSLSSFSFVFSSITDFS